MSAQSPSLTEILTKLGEDWSIVRDRFNRHRAKPYVDDDKAFEQEDENRDEAFHKHPFPGVLEWVTGNTGIPSDLLREAALKHFERRTKLVKELGSLDDKGRTRELWERLAKECPSVLCDAGLMPEKPTGAPPLPPVPDKGEGNGGKITASTIESDLHRKFMERAVEEARKSQTEDDRVHPKVGVVIVKDGEELAVAYRGELKEGDHAEYTALEKKLTDVEIAGATVYTTLEPCTSRKHPKLPCAVRLMERKVKRVVIGMLDPNPKISGKGVRKLREASIAVDFFPTDLMSKIEEMNREFIRHHKNASEPALLATLTNWMRRFIGWLWP